MSDAVPKDEADRIRWILECGCEPCYTHCGQCDSRRALVTKERRRENPDSGDIVLMPWRTGRKVGKNVYAIVGDEPSDDDIDIGRFDSESVAAIAVLQHNNALKELEK